MTTGPFGGSTWEGSRDSGWVSQDPTQQAAQRPPLGQWGDFSLLPDTHNQLALARWPPMFQMVSQFIMAQRTSEGMCRL